MKTNLDEVEPYMEYKEIYVLVLRNTLETAITDLEKAMNEYYY